MSLSEWLELSIEGENNKGSSALGTFMRYQRTGCVGIQGAHLGRVTGEVSDPQPVTVYCLMSEHMITVHKSPVWDNKELFKNL